MQSRRQFLSESLRASTAVAIAPVGTFLNKRLPHVPLGHLHHQSFAPHLHSMFRVSNGRVNTAMILVEATKTKTASGENFLLRFRGPARNAYEQGTYVFQHDHIGTFDLFIVPGKGNKSVQEYRAIINRI